MKIICSLTKRFLVLFVLSLFTVGSVLAQEVTVSGIVKDDAGILPGVNVVIKGTQKGTITDFNGNYTISVNATDTLQFSFTGLMTSVEPVNGRKTIDVILKEDRKIMDAVVVVAYAEQKAKEVTGAVSVINADVLKQTPTAGLDQALQGRSSGVMVSKDSGEPGGGVKIRIRGVSSIQASNEPLYIIDGIPVNDSKVGNQQTGSSSVSNPMSNINPDDIETISILKDAAATAIYGARGANGVVLITTKRGKNGVSEIDFSAYHGVSYVGNRYKLADSREYTALTNYGRSLIGIPTTDYTKRDWTRYNTNWQDEIFRPGPTTNVGMTMRGGTEKGQYMVSAGYFNQEGVVIGSDFTRYSLRANVDQKLNDKIKFGTSLSFSYNTGRRQRNSGSANADGVKGTGGPIVKSALLASPAIPVYDENDVDGDGNTSEYFFDDRNRDFFNPVAMAKEQKLIFQTSRVLGSGYGEWDIMKGLKYKYTVGFDVRSENEDFYYAPLFDAYNEHVVGSGRASVQNYFEVLWSSTHILTYHKSIRERHNINVLLGQETQNSDFDQSFATAQGFLNENVTTLAGGTDVHQNPSTVFEGWGLVSYFGRFNYNFKEKYLFEANIRKDGSSRFGLNNRWGTFPSYSVGWNISDEDFIMDNDKLSFIYEAKLRASHGTSGNWQVGNLAHYGALWYSEKFPGSDWSEVLNYLGYKGATVMNVSALDYSWEEQVQTNVGLDMAFFKNKVSATVEYYYRKGNGLLLSYGVPFHTGVGDIVANSAVISNEGYEMQVNTTNMRKDIGGKRFQWNTNFNFSTNEFLVHELIESYKIGGRSILQEGETMRYKAYVREDELDANGNVSLVDIDGDGYISEGAGSGLNDQSYFNSPLPKFFGGMNNSITYGNWDLGVFFQYVYGNLNFNDMRKALEGSAPVGGNSHIANVTQDYYDNVYVAARTFDEDHDLLLQINTNTNVAVPNYIQKVQQIEGNNSHIEDGSYLRLKTLSVGYRLPQKVVDRIGAVSARAYVTVTNIWTLTNYSGFDPEVSSISGEGFAANMSVGVDDGAYPQPKSFTVGVNVKF